MQPQGELFPYATPETVLAYSRRIEAMVLTIAPEMSRADCLRMLEELVLATSVLDRISLNVRTRREWQARQQLPAMPEREVPDERLEEARHWERAHPPITYQPRTQTPAWPDRGHWRRYRR